MSTAILATKLYIPPPRLKIVLRPLLIERLNEGLSSGCKLTLISAPAGFGKTTLVSEWLAGCQEPAAWLSLDEGDNDPTRFLTYLVAALQTLSPKTGGANIGKGVLAILQSPQPLPPIESILISLLNEITTVSDDFVLVLDDYHLIDSKPVDDALTFLVEHLPPQMHLVVATREDPALPLPRLRVRGQLTELRAADLRFTPAEAAEFLNQVMGLNLSAEDIAALETRTEGWIAGLQLAALSMQGNQDTANFIKSFTGSHHFVLDYLIEEVLQQQPESIQIFLLHTSILDRLCGSLCDSVLGSPSASGKETSGQESSGQQTLEYLERANLFIVPLDDERHWYRYHHLFGDLLRKRLAQNLTPDGIAKLHIHASEWYEKNGRIFEAFKHAAAANDIERAERLMELKEMPLRLPGVPMTILKWLESLPTSVLNSKPSLWWKQAAMMLSNYQVIGVEEKLQATEAALALRNLPNAAMDEWTRNLVGKIAVARALLAQTQYQAETSLVQARRALEYLHPNNVAYRSTANQIVGFAHYLQGDRDAAEQAYTAALSLAQSAGDYSGVLMATTRLGQIYEIRNKLHQAAEIYQHALQLFGEDPPPLATVAIIGLARIHMEWNELESAEKYGEQGYQLARLCDQVIDRLITSELFLCRLKLAQGDPVSAARFLSQAEQNARQNEFAVRLPDIAYAQVMILLRQGNIDAAAQLAQQFDLPLTQAHVLLTQHNASAALTVLEPLYQQAEAKGWVDRQLSVMAVQSMTLYAHGEKEKAVERIGKTLAMAEPGGFIRLFVDEGAPMAQLLSEAASRGVMPDYISRLLAAFEAEAKTIEVKPDLPLAQPLIEPLSQRELKVLRLIAGGLSNREISARLFLALSTVKGYNQKIFDKLQVQSRTEAIARARELGLL